MDTHRLIYKFIYEELMALVLTKVNKCMGCLRPQKVLQSPFSMKDEIDLGEANQLMIFLPSLFLLKKVFRFFLSTSTLHRIYSSHQVLVNIFKKSVYFLDSLLRIKRPKLALIQDPSGLSEHYSLAFIQFSTRILVEDYDTPLIEFQRHSYSH